VNGVEADLAAVNGVRRGDGGVAHGAALIAFTEAVMGRDAEARARERAALRAVLTPAEFVDACAVIAAFNVVDRIADATGIPLDEPLLLMSGPVREELDLARFASAANTPGAR
jgi:alkylhydroperoxidase family enzyme